MRLLLYGMYSELQKYKHSSILWIHIFVPILGAAIFLSYYRISAMENIVKVSTYFEVISITFPTLIGIICGISVNLEEQNCFHMVLTNKSRLITYISKLLLLLILGGLSTIMAIIVFAIGFQKVIVFGVYIRAALIIIASNAVIYMIHLLLSFRFGKAASIIVGACGSIVGALMLTGLGEGIWQFVPYGTSGRLCGYMVFQKLAYPSADILKYIQREISFALSIMMPITTIILILSLFWFSRWEGRNSCE